MQWETKKPCFFFNLKKLSVILRVIWDPAAAEKRSKWQESHNILFPKEEPSSIPERPQKKLGRKSDIIF